MSSFGGGIGSTLTGGIQDVAAILPLLGTEQCSVQVGSALTRGYLYAASAPMSIFGSLGVVSAGFKTLVACFSFRNIEGAKLLGNMGFEPQGENLSLIMVEAGKGENAGRYVFNTRMDELIDKLNIDKNRITGVSHKSAPWNIKMLATTALLSVLSITPYIYLNQVANTLNKSTIWLFPVLRATGGFITATLIQILIQRRITTLSDQYLANRDDLPNRDQQPTDVEAAGDTGANKCQMIARRIAPTWLLLYLLLIGLIASVGGYVGCFSVVQSSRSTVGPVSWLCLEVGLSVMRLAIWAWNPTGDEAPPLEIILKLDKNRPLPTCNKDNEEILQYKVLPLTRAREFLKMITSFAGLIEPFSNPDFSLYYTLTWKHPSKKSALADKHKLGERTLYITVFDHKERTTRVYNRDNEIDTFYSTKSNAPIVDVGRFLLEVEIDAKIDLKDDPVSNDSSNLKSLHEHHRSILEHIQYRLGDGAVTKPYVIENKWTMKTEDTISTVQRLRKKNRDDWKMGVEKGKKEERNEESLPICDYLDYFMPSKERQLLYEKRVKWIARRMEMIGKETKERFQEMEGVYRVNRQALEVTRKPATKSPEEIEQLLCREQYLMELLLLYEVKEWEVLFWNKLEPLLYQIGNDRVEGLMREWRADCLKRFNPQMDAAVSRLAKSDSYLGEWLASSISQLWVERHNSISLSELRRVMGYLDEEIRLRMEKEIEDTEFRLKRGSDLGRFDQFWDDDTLFECRYSRSKWLYFKPDSTVPHEIYLHYLKGNKNSIHITFDGSGSDFNWFDWFEATISDLPWVTSISGIRISEPGQCSPLFIKSNNNDLNTFAKEIRLKLDPFSTYIFTDVGRYDMYRVPDRLGKALENYAKVLISFVAPTSGQSLILRLKHSGREDAPLEVTLGSTTIHINSPTKSSLTIDDITLYPIQDPVPFESDLLLFAPDLRNDIVIQFVGPWGHGHILHDIELLDEAGLKPLAMWTAPDNERSQRKWIKQKFRSVFSSKSKSLSHNFDGPDALPTSTNVPPINASFLASQARGNSPSDGPRVKADRTGSGQAFVSDVQPSAFTGSPTPVNATTSISHSLNQISTINDNLRMAWHGVESLLQNAERSAAETPAQGPIAIVDALIELENAFIDNKDALEGLNELVTRTAECLAVVNTVNEDEAVPRNMIEYFSGILTDFVLRLNKMSERSLWMKILNSEEDKKKIAEIFERTKIFYFKLMLTIERNTRGLRDSLARLQLDSWPRSSRAHYNADFEGSGTRRACTPGTRVPILDRIYHWAQDTSPYSSPVFLLMGKAGSGKSTIANTVCYHFDKDDESLDDEVPNILQASYFCSGQFDDTRRQKYIIPTLVYQLARHSKSYARALLDADKFDSVEIPSKQLQDLFVGPWQKSAGDRPNDLPPYLIVIDALDEVDDGGGFDFFQTLLTTIFKGHLQGLKFFVTSREDDKVASLCNNSFFSSDAVCRLAEADVSADSDILR